jgi:type III restriction enzyme
MRHPGWCLVTTRSSLTITPPHVQPVTKPPTLLIDSDALENSGQVDDDFKKVFAREIEMFKARLRPPARAGGRRTHRGCGNSARSHEYGGPAQHAGRPHPLRGLRLHAHRRLDAKTVTHIAGLRAFGSQLLCEQVAGRALRRKSYFLQGYDKAGQPTTDKRKIVDWRFPPEYAHIIGVPFKLFKGGRSVIQPPVDAQRVHALRERTDRYEITFPASKATGWTIPRAT